MTKKMTKKKMVEEQLRPLCIGSKTEFPIEELELKRVYISKLGLKTNRVYYTRVDRERGVLLVFRVK